VAEIQSVLRQQGALLGPDRDPSSAAEAIATAPNEAPAWI